MEFRVGCCAVEARSICNDSFIAKTSAKLLVHVLRLKHKMFINWILIFPFLYSVSGQIALPNVTIESQTSYIDVWIFESGNSSLRVTSYEISRFYIGPCDLSSSSPSYRAYIDYGLRNRTYTQICSNFPCHSRIYSLLSYSDYLITVTSIIGNIRAATISQTIRTLPTAPLYGHPPRVSLVQIVDVTTLSIEWEKVECVFQGGPLNYSLRYGIYDEISGVSNYSVFIDTTNRTYTFNLTDLTLNTDYVFEVSAYNTFGQTQYYRSGYGYRITNSGILEEIPLVARTIGSPNGTLDTFPHFFVYWSSLPPCYYYNYRLDYRYARLQFDIFYVGLCLSNTEYHFITVALPFLSCYNYYTVNSYSYTMALLVPYTEYIVNITAIDGDIRSETVSHRISTSSTVPGGTPCIVSVDAVNTTAFSIEWNELDCEDRNGMIVGYVIRYSALNNEFEPVDTRNVSLNGSTTLLHTLSGLKVDTPYQIEIAAVNNVGQGPFQESTEYGFEIQKDGRVKNISLVNNNPLVEGVDYTPFTDLMEDDCGVLREVGHTDDGCSDLVYPEGGLPFGLNTMTEMRVCVNGIISMGSSHFSMSRPERFPSADPVVSESNLLAPMWNDHDARMSSSHVYYKEYAQDQGDLADMKLGIISAFITNQQNLQQNFSGTWMMVAQWDEVPPYPFGLDIFRDFQDSAPRNTYQAVVITDQIESYAVFTYSCDRMEWFSTGGHTLHSVIGYNTDQRSGSLLGDTLPSFQNYQLSGFPNLKILTCKNEERRVDWSNLVYLIGNATIAELGRAECLKQVKRDNEEFRSIVPCPCSLNQAFRDNRYRYASSHLSKITRDNSFSNDRYCFVQNFPPRSFEGTQLCCYSRTGALLDTSAGYRGSSLLRYHPFSNPDEYLKYDHLFKKSCCSDSDLCDMYTRKRPSDDCSTYRPPRRAWCWGDPHVTNLDGGVRTFNGWGEYPLLLILTNDTNFYLQGRLQPLENSTATQLVAFAFGDPQQATVEVRLDGQTLQLIVLVNGQDITPNITDTNATYSTSDLTLTRTGPTTLSCIFPNDIGMAVSLVSTMLGFTVIVPERYRGLTGGLSGNYNGEKRDDLVFQNGTMVAPTVSDRVFHEVAQSWQIRPEDSLFTYPEGKTASDFAHPEHMPVFLDEVVAAADQDIISACDGDRECIFDTCQTGDLSIGLDTKATDEQIIDDQNQATNFPPIINGSSSLYIVLGEEARFTFNVTDDKNMYNVTVTGGLPVNSALTSTPMDGYSEYLFTWNHHEAVNTSLSFEAKDELDAVSMLIVQVYICACQNGGNCTLNGVFSSHSTVVLNCICPEAWEGRFCSDDVDGCKEIGCFEGVICFDMPAPGVGAICGPCPDGFLGDGTKCYDVDECAERTDNCADVCVNLQGSFECACSAGYQLLNSTHCEDIDECAILNGNCHQLCNNFIGGYNCSCDLGYELSADDTTCSVLPEAECTSGNNCSQNCVRLNGIETCSCNRGYQLLNRATCENVDECEESPCEQWCTDTEGSFFCSCNSGFMLSSDRLQCNDVNECVQAALAGEDICSSPMFCFNTIGGYLCECPGGTENVAGKCVTEPICSPPTVTLPMDPSMYVVMITVVSYSLTNFTDDAQQAFKRTTVVAINSYCQMSGCTSLTMMEQCLITEVNVILTDFSEQDQTITFNMYVQAMDRFLPSSETESAIEMHSDEYSLAGFTVTVTLLNLNTTATAQPVPPLTVEQIIGIGVGGGLGVLCIIAFFIILLCCCFKGCSKTKKSKQPAGLEMIENPHIDKGSDNVEVADS